MSAAASVVEYALQLARAGTAAILAVSLGTSATAANRTGLYADLTASAEQVKIVAGAVDGAAFGVSSSDIRLTLQAGARDGIRMAPRGGGSGTYVATITTAALTASRTITLSDADQILAGSTAALTSGRVPYVTTGGRLIDDDAHAATSSTFTVGNGTSANSFTVRVNALAGQNAQLSFMKGTVNRWITQSNSTAESGANAGSDWELLARSDAGSSIDIPITIARAAGGLITLVRPLTTSGNIAQTGSGTVSTGTGVGTYNHTSETHAGVVTIGNSAQAAPLVAFRDTTAGASTNQVGIDVGNSGTSQGKGRVIYTNAAAAGSPVFSLSFQPRNNADTTAINPANITFTKTGGADTATVDVFSAGTGLRITTTGTCAVTSATDATDTITGSLTTLGGISYGASKTLYGGSVNLAGNITQTGSGTVSTGTGSVSLNGATTVNAALALTQGTITTSSPQINATVTWNAGGVTFTAWKLNVTSTASAAASLLADLQLGGTSQFKIDKAGASTQLGGITHGSATLLTTTTALTNGAAAAAATILNAPAAGNPTKWVPINDNGIIRYIPAW